MTVTLRQRKKGDKISLYLEYYNNGSKEYEYLKLYLIVESPERKLTRKEKDDNRMNLDLAEAIRSKRHFELKNGIFGFQDLGRMKGSFIKYFETLTEKRKEQHGNYGNWNSALKHLKKFAQGDVSFDEITKQWLENFKAYLQNAQKSSIENQKLAQNSQHSYFNKIRAALREAHKDGNLLRNPINEVDGIKAGEPEREFLTYDELIAMSKTDCDIPVLKRAFLFSALTGLRWSDINKLTWAEVQHSKEIGNYIRFTQKKTKGAETLPINEDALKLLGDRTKQEERVFTGLKYSAWHNFRLLQWAMKAGITKTITFHCARHTYATLQLTLGTDIYTVSKLLGHKDLKTTQIYAKIIDERKTFAATKIKLDI